MALPGWKTADSTCKTIIVMFDRATAAAMLAWLRIWLSFIFCPCTAVTQLTLIDSAATGPTIHLASVEGPSISSSGSAACSPWQQQPVSGKQAWIKSWVLGSLAQYDPEPSTIQEFSRLDICIRVELYSFFGMAGHLHLSMCHRCENGHVQY
jgi:hypothetical protein